VAALAEASLVLRGESNVVPHADAASEFDVPVRAVEVPLERLFLRKEEQLVDPLARDLPLLPLLPLRHG